MLTFGVADKYNQNIKLTPYQLTFYYEWLRDPQRSDYNIVIDNNISGDIDIANVNQSFLKLSKEHFILSHRISHEKDNVCWLPREPLTDIVRYFEEPLTDDEIYELVSAPFDLENDAYLRINVIRLEENVYRMVFVFHHLVVDGISTEEIWQKFRCNYNSTPYNIISMDEQRICHRELAARFDDILLNHEAEFRQFWQTRLQGIDGIDLSFLFNGRHVTPSERLIVDECLFSFDENVYAQVKSLKYRYKITPYLFGQMVLAILLHKLTNKNELAIAYPIAFAEGKALFYGSQINTLLIDYRFVPGQTLASLTEHVLNFFRQLKCTKAKYLPVDEIVQYADSSDVLNVSFAQTLFRDHVYGLDGLHDDGVNHDFQIDLVNQLIIEQEEYLQNINYRVRFDARLVAKERIEQFIAMYQRLFHSVLALMTEGRADTQISTLSLLDEPQRLQILEQWNDTRHTAGLKSSVVEAFEDMVNTYPQRTAIVYQENKLTYQQLNSVVNALGAWLKEHYDLQPNQIVALCMGRSEWTVVSMLAILKAGAAYVPVSSSAPDERIAYIVRDTKACVVLTDEFTKTRLLETLDEIPVQEVNAAFCQALMKTYAAADQGLTVDPDHLAYVIYTSGTTGVPKGVAIEHRGLINLAKSQGERFGLGVPEPAKRCLWYADYVFDAHVSEVYTAIANGHTLYVLEEEKRLDFKALQHYVRDNEIAIATIPPVLLDKEQLLALQVLVVAGDVTPTAILENYARAGCCVINAYGPTEASVCSSLHTYQIGDSNINIGRPLNNVTCYILDQNLSPVPVGVTGMLYIGGDGIARGYLNNPALTAASFIINPFQSATDAANHYNARLYKTGDLARYNQKGEIEYLGRNDFQVKIRGFRIELEEIETRLLCCQSVEKAIVLARQNAVTDAQYLAAYYVASTELDSNVLADTLRQSLPDYMIPAAFVQLPELPVLPSGKVNRHALPEVDFTLGKHYIAPTSECEQQLCGFFADVLGVNAESLGINDDFFHLGGDSISGIQLVSRIRQKLNADIGVSDIFTLRTVKNIAQYIGQKSYQQTDRVPSEQGILSGAVPLLPVQQWFFNQVRQGNFKQPNYWNQCFALQLPGTEQTLLRRSLNMLAHYHDAFRLGYSEDAQAPEGIRQFYDENAPELPLHFISEQQLNGPEFQAQIEILQTSFDLAKPPLCRALCVQNAKGQGTRLYFIMHHLMVDAVSWRIIRSDLQAIYSALASGQCAADSASPLGPKGSSYRQWSTAIADYQGNDGEKEKEYWLAISQQAREYNQLLETLATREPVKEKVAFDVTLTRKLTHEINQVYQTQINDVLLSALALALTDLTGQQAHTLSLEGHGRESIGKSLNINGTVGWFTTIYPVTLVVAPGSDERTLVSVKESLKQVPHHGVGYGPLVGYAQMPLPKVNFNYLGQFDLGDNLSPWSFVQDDYVGLSASPANREDSVLAINGAIINGELQFVINGYLSAATLKSFIDSFRQRLNTLVTHLSGIRRRWLTPADIDYVIGQPLLDELQEHQDIERLYLANSLQQGFIYHAISQGDEDDAYRTQLHWDYHSPIDPERMQAAWRLAQQNFPTLRLRFSWKEALVQVIDKEGRLDWRFVDLSSHPDDEQENALQQLIEKDRNQPYDLALGSLFRLYLVKRRHDLFHCVFSSHHAILDGWSNGVLLAFVHRSYLDLLDGKRTEPAGDACYFAAQQYLQQNSAIHLDYWQNYLRVAADRDRENLSALYRPDLGQIPLSEHRQITDAREARAAIAGDDYAAMKRLCTRYGVTTNALLQYFWHKLLSLYGSCDITVVGMTVAGRNLPLAGIEESVGLYINTLPIVVQHEDMPVTAAIQALQQAIHDGNDRSCVDLVKLQNAGERLFNTLFVYENYPLPEELHHGGRLSITFNQAKEKQDYPLVLTVHENDSQVRINLQYAGELFDPNAIALLMERFPHFIKQLVAQPDIHTGALQNLLEKEYQTLVLERNAPRRPRAARTINRLFADQVAVFPERRAVKYQDRYLTYRELDAQSTRLACYLRAQYSLKADDRVALLLARSEWQLVAILAVLKCGAAYVPLDPHAASERLNYMLTDSGARVVLTDMESAAYMQQILQTTADLCTIDEPSFVQRMHTEAGQQNLEDLTKPQDLAYIIYTSGTTGQPKGVMVEHRNVVNLFTCTEALYPFNHEDVWTLFHAYTFDFSVWEIWGALFYGGLLVIPDNDTARDSDMFYDLCQREGVTILNQTPRAFYQFIDVAQDKANRLNSLRYVIFGGEALNFSQLRQWYALYDDGPSLVNMYGITETTVHVTYKALSANALGAASLIGHTLPEYTAYVLDKQHNPVPIGVTGELYIGGNGVARGYLNNPELTAERFIANPFQSAEQREQGYNDRLYKTGDLARLLPDGELAYIGRSDFQVKIRGFRIELGEIEARLGEHPNIKKTVVLVHETQGGNKQLIAYYVEDTPTDVAALAQYLRQHLPDYMIPAAFMPMDDFPLTVNGKLDRSKMPAPTFIQAITRVAPSTATEVALCQIFAQVLNIEPETIGIEDDFFQSGGDSISCIQLINRIRQQLGEKLSVKDVFAARTVCALAKKIAAQDSSRTRSEQGELSGSVGLLPVQAWFFDRAERGLYDEANHWNQSVLLDVPALDIPILRAAISKLVAYHDALRMTFSVRTREANYLPQAEHIHCSAVTAADYPNGSLETLLTNWQSRFDIEQGPLYHIGYLADFQEGRGRLHLALHHLIVDAVSLRIIKDDLHSIYQHLLAHRDAIETIEPEQILGLKGTSYRQWEEALRSYAQENQSEADYWRKVVAESLPSTHALSKFAVTELSHAEIIFSELETEQILRGVHDVYRTAINDLLLAALAQALEDCFQLGCYAVLLEGHGREAIADDLELNRTVGWFTSFYPLLLTSQGEEGLAPIVNIKDRLRRLPHHGVGYGALLGYRDEEMPKIAFNYLGNFSSRAADASQWRFTDENAGVAVSARNGNDLILNLNGMVIGNRLSFFVEGKLPADAVTRFANAWQQRIREQVATLATIGRRFMTQADIGDVVSASLLARLQAEREIDAVYRANSLQQGFIWHALSQGDTDEAYRTQMVWEYHSELNETLLQQAWRLAQQRFPALRLRFSWEEEIVQVIDHQGTLDWRSLDLSGKTESVCGQDIDALLTSDRAQAYDLSAGSLFRITLVKQRSDLFTCIFNNHHAILDGWSNPVLLAFVHDCYETLCRGQSVSVEVDASYPAAQSYLQQHRQHDSDFWKGYLGKLEESEDLSALLKPELRAQSLVLADCKYVADPREMDLTLDEREYQALKALCRQYGVTPNVLLQYLWHKQLSVYGNTQTTVLGMTVSGRNIPVDGIENAVGLFINTLPVILHHGERPVLAALAELQESVNEVNNRSDAPLAKLQKNGQRLFNSLFIFENYPTPDDSRPSALRFSFCKVQEKMDYPLVVTAYETGQRFMLKLRYAGELFSEQILAQAMSGMKYLLEQLQANPHLNEHQFEYLTPALKAQMLVEWNNTRSPYPETYTIARAFSEQVARTPDAVAVKWNGIQLSYRQLDRQSDLLAQHLQATYRIKPDDLLVLLLDRSHLTVVAVLAVLKAGAGYVPVDPQLPDERLALIMTQTQAKAVLTDVTHQPRVDDLLADERGVEVIDSADYWSMLAARYHATAALPAETRPDSLAYVLFTSGTTGNPKGVMIEQRAWLNLIYHFKNTYFAENECVTTFSVTNYVFDIWGLEYGLPLLTGGYIELANSDFEKIETAPYHFIQMTPSVWSACIDKIVFNNPALNILIGGENVNSSLLGTLFDGRPLGAVLNVYGPTETTIWSTCQRNTVYEYDGSIGRPIANTELYVLNRYHQPVPVGAPGELYIGGEGLARGYLNDEALTSRSFIPLPWQTAGDARLYRTGDIVRYLPDGRLEFIGRNDFQVKIRGFRIELGEIESRMATYPGIRQAVVAVREHDSGNKYLIGYYVAEGAIAEEALRHYLSQHLSDYKVPAVLTRLPEFPLTLSGKVDRRALPNVEFSGSLQHYVAPITPLEETLCELFAESLGVPNIGTTDNFFSLGGDSILVIKLVNQINQINQRIPHRKIHLNDIFSYPTVGQLAAQLSEENDREAEPIIAGHVGRPQDQALSFAQQRLWFLDRYQRGSHAYNIPILLKLREQVNLSHFTLALQTVVNRHEVLRSLIKENAQGEGYQEVLSYPLRIDEVYVTTGDRLKAELEKAVNDIFMLEREYPIRVTVYRLAQERYISIVVHHIAFDGWSMDVLIRELITHYHYFEALSTPDGTAEQYQLPPLTLQYRDFALWQRDYLSGNVMQEMESWWLNQLADVETLDLPVDRARPPQMSYQGTDYAFELTPEVSRGLRYLAQRSGVTLYSVLLSAYYLLLSLYSNQKDIVVGTPFANRNHGDLGPLIGFFVNTLPLRHQVDKAQSISELISQVSRTISEAQAHQELPLERLIEILKVEQDSSRHPIFQVTFVMESFGKERQEEADKLFEPYRDLVPTVAKFDLTLTMNDAGERLFGAFNYASALFDEQTIASMTLTWRHLLAQFAELETSEKPIGQLSYICPEQRQRVMQQWNATERDYPKTQSLIALFEAQVASMPEREALVCEGKVLSYRALNEAANRLARYLTERFSIMPDSVIGLYMGRSICLPIAMLATLKAGAAYAPIDPGAPSERVAYIIKDTGTSILLTDAEYHDELRRLCADAAIDIITVGGEQGLEQKIAGYSADNLPFSPQPEQLAYVIYTSGTTGQPKGVMIEHASAVNFVMAAAELLGIANRDETPQRCLWLSNYVFDAHIYDVYTALIYGHCVHLLTGERRTDLVQLQQYVAEQNIDVGYIPPVLLDHEHRVGLKKLVIAGEVANAQTIAFYLDHRVQVYNLYGPTEITVGSHFHQMSFNDKNTNLGQTIFNDKSYLLDEHLNMLPIGAIGEIYIGGAGVSRGYLNNPALTAERFLPNPFQSEHERRAGVNRRIYKTGDLARYRFNGDIEYIGRNDFQVKIRGLRIELGEIEVRLSGYPDIQKVFVTTREHAHGGHYIVAYYVAECDIAADTLNRYLSQYLPDYMLPVSYVWMTAFPYTRNGKLDRRQLPAPQLSLRKADCAPKNEAEVRLRDVFADVLKLDAQQMSVEDSFFALGGNSILVIKLANLASQAFGKALPVAAVFIHKTVRKLIHNWWESETEHQAPIPVAPAVDGRWPLSYAQQRLWLIGELQNWGSVYNIPIFFKLTDAVDIDIFICALRALVHRHEVLRTLIKHDAVSGVYQEVIDDERTPLQVAQYDCHSLEHLYQRVGEAGNHRFKLDSEYPVFVTRYVVEQENYMSIVVHHIAFDGWSADVMMRELYAFYHHYAYAQRQEWERANRCLPEPLDIQYRDFAVWQRDYLSGERLEKLLTFWKGKLAGYQPLNLPLDRPYATDSEHAGCDLSFTLDTSVSNALRTAARKLDVSLYSLLLSGYFLLLMTYSGQDDVVTGTPMANRDRSQTEGLIGFFVNSLVLRQKIDRGQPLTAFVRAVSDTVIEAQLHQDLPFDLLVSELHVVNDANRNPIFQTIFSVQSFGNEKADDENPLIELCDLDARFGNRVAKFDLSTMIDDSKAAISGGFNYASTLFDAQTVASYVSTYVLILEQLASLADESAPQVNVGDLRYVSTEMTGVSSVDGDDTDWDQFEV